MTLLACSAAAVPARAPAVAPETTALTVANDASSLYRIDRVIAVVDGSVALDADLDDGERARVDLGLPDGDHALQLLVKASYPSGSIGERCAVELRAVRAFRVDERGAEVAARIETGALTLGFGDRVDLQLDLRGATEIAFADMKPAPSPEEAACSKLGPIRGSACSGERLLAEAERDRDVVKALCYRDKTSVLRAYAQAFGETEAALAGPAPDAVSPARRADLAVITRNALAVRHEMESCVASDPAFVEPLSRTVVGERCTGTEPFEADAF